MSNKISLSPAQQNTLRAFIIDGTAKVEVNKTIESLATKGLIIFADGEWRLTNAGLREAKLYALVDEDSIPALVSRTHEARAAEQTQAESKPEPEAESAETQTAEDGTVFIIRRGRKYILRHPAAELKSKPVRISTLKVFADTDGFTRNDAEGVFKPSVDILWENGLLERAASDATLFRITAEGIAWLAKHALATE